VSTHAESFEDYTPLARFPPVLTPWTDVRIDQSPSQLGPWTTIDTFALNPVDLDPTLPATRNFTTLAAVDGGGDWFRVVFLDADSNEEVTDPVTFPKAGQPRTGPCSPWITGSDLGSFDWVAKAAAKWLANTTDPPQPRTQAQLDALYADAATQASELLYELSGRIFTGACGPVTIRPVARPSDADTRGIRGLGAGSWYYSWGSGYGATPDMGTVARYGRTDPPTIVLGGYPVTAILEVKIDGVVIPPDEYELRDYKQLVRMRPTAASAPTERYGWPTSQLQDLPDDQPGTFSVTYTYGVAPLASGVLACRKLAEYLALPQLGDTTKVPQRVTSVQRQGISAMVVDVMDIVKTGRTGIYEVDIWLRSVNPHQNARQAAVYSPDLGRARRVPNPSV